MEVLKILCASMMFMGTFGVLQENGMLTITIIYESYCEHSIAFITQQVIPLWEKLGDFVEIEFIPFGLTRLSPNGNPTCGAGVLECDINKLHACAIDVACKGQTSLCCPNNQLGMAMSYIKCIMQSPDQNRASLQCAQVAGLNPQDFNTCMMSRSNYLLSHYMKLRGHFAYSVNSSPFFLIDGVNTDNEVFVQYNLEQFVCSRLQSECSYQVCLGVRGYSHEVDV